jgi:ribosomal-protein-alanine N-acetyltransferase
VPLRLTAYAGESDFSPAGAETAARIIATLMEIPRDPPWGCYLARAGGDIVGACAFKAAPDAEGVVEIAYATFAPFEGQGHATAMIAALVEIGRAGGAAVIIAHTLPQMGASARALFRNRFDRCDAFDDPEDGPVWYWERVLDPTAA